MLMHDLLRDGAERTPDRIALRWVDRDKAVTYAESVALMDRMAGALASAPERAMEAVSALKKNFLVITFLLVKNRSVKQMKGLPQWKH